jgi:hypothetical protein
MPTLPPRRDDWPEEAKELYDERAAIVEYDGNVSRSTANARAERMVREQWTRQGVAEPHGIPR